MKTTKEQRMRQMALVDWVKQAIFDAMQIWIKDHEDELSQLIVDSLSERIEISFSPRLYVKQGEQTNEPATNGEQDTNTSS